MLRLGGRLPLARLDNIFHYDLEREMMDDLRRAFDKLDDNQDGVISVQERGDGVARTRT